MAAEKTCAVRRRPSTSSPKPQKVWTQYTPALRNCSNLPLSNVSNDVLRETCILMRMKCCLRSQIFLSGTLTDQALNKRRAQTLMSFCIQWLCLTVRSDEVTTRSFSARPTSTTELLQVSQAFSMMHLAILLGKTAAAAGLPTMSVRVSRPWELRYSTRHSTSVTDITVILSSTCHVKRCSSNAIRKLQFFALALGHHIA